MTAVEIFIKQLQDRSLGVIKNAIVSIERILDIEKQQIKDAYNQGFRDGQKNWDIILKNDIKECSNSENYYNETFNK